jgi:hypothetical protein
MCVLFIATGCKQVSPSGKDQTEQSKIKSCFNTWVSNEIAAGRYWAMDSCNVEYFKKYKNTSRVDHAVGIPDSSKIRFSFSDVNKDGVLDGLVTFNPVFCDCRERNGWTQYQFLVLSLKNSFAVNDTFFSSIGNTLKGFYQLSGIENEKFTGIYYEFHEGEVQCCPTIERPIAISYKTRELEFLK